MSYCRWSSGDVYMFHHCDGYICCCGCCLNPVPEDGVFPEDATFTTRSKAVAHLAEHKAAGHVVPEYACTELLDEIQTLGDAVK